MKKKEKTEGITLIALVVTIIILMILAGITTNLLLGDNSVIEAANKQKIITEQSLLLESMKMNVLSYEIKSLSNRDVEGYLKGKNIIDNNKIVDVDTITNDFYTGRGNLEEGDYYYLENGYLYYMSKKKEEKELGLIYKPVATTNVDIYTYEDEEKTIITGIKEEYIVKPELEENVHYKGNPRIIVVDEKEITEITIPAQVIAIREQAFYSYFHLEKVNFNDNLKEIGSYVFEACTSLTQIELKEGITEIGRGAFDECWNLTRVTILGEVSVIAPSTFWNCEKLEEVNLPNSIISIESDAFRYCRKLTRIKLPNTLQKIRQAAFSYSGLTSIEIPNSVTEIRSSAFEECPDLIDIYCELPSKPDGWSSNWLGTYSSPTVHWGKKMPTE